MKNIILLVAAALLVNEIGFEKIANSQQEIKDLARQGLSWVQADLSTRSSNKGFTTRLDYIDSFGL